MFQFDVLEEIGEVYKVRIGFAEDVEEEQSWFLDTVGGLDLNQYYFTKEWQGVNIVGNITSFIVALVLVGKIKHFKPHFDKLLKER